MIVHIAGSIHDIAVDVDYLRQVVEIAHNRGAVIALNWIDPAVLRHKENIITPNWTSYVKDNINAVKRADVVVADITHYSFAQGYVVAAALQNKKPVLAISRNTIHGHTASGISHSLFTYKKYANAKELQTIVNDFLIKNTIHTKELRLNIFLTRRIFKYLEDTTRETGKSRSSIIRELIMRRMENENHG